MIIDAHAHLASNPEDLERIVNSKIVEQVWLLDVGPVYPSGVGSVKFASSEEVLKTASEYKGFFVPFGHLDFREKPEIVDKLFEKGFVGLKAIRPPKPYDDPSYFPYYAKAESLKMPILFHTQIIGHATQKEVGAGLSLGPTNMKPSMLQTIAAAFPSLAIIGGHPGFPWQEEAFWSLWYYANIRHDISGGDFVPLFEWLLKVLNYRDYRGQPLAEKILFATDSLYGRQENHDRVLEEASFWQQLFKRTSPYFYWKGDEEKIMRLNAAKIMEGLIRNASRGGKTNDKKYGAQA